LLKGGFLLLCFLAGSAMAQDSPCTSAQHSEYLRAVQERITSNWRLASHYNTVSCTVLIAQTFRGEILNAAVQGCTDPEIVKTIEDATYLSSPLPLPGNGSCFERRIEVRIVRKPG